jgi:hypothetical protein
VKPKNDTPVRRFDGRTADESLQAFNVATFFIPAYVPVRSACVRSTQGTAVPADKSTCRFAALPWLPSREFYLINVFLHLAAIDVGVHLKLHA